MTEIHKTILKILLIALAVTATAGVVSILMENDMLGRVTGTGFFVVLAALIMLKISASLENPKLRSASMFGLAVIAVEFLVVAGLIWADSIGFHNSHGELWATFFTVMFWSLFTALAIRGIAVPYGRLAGWIGVGFAGLTILTAMVAIWIGGHNDDEWSGTSALFALMGLAISACCVGLGVREDGLPQRPWRWIGVLAGASCVIVGVVFIWTDPPGFIGDSPMGQTMSIAGLIALYVGFANLCLIGSLKPGQMWLLYGTLAIALVLVFMAALLVFEVGHEDDMLRYIAATSIPTACGAIALAVVHRLNRRAEFEMTAPDYLLIHLTCPRCRASQQVKPGKSHCDRCQLKFDITIEEPKCPACGYLLYMLEGDHCPECGTDIIAGEGNHKTVSTPTNTPPSAPSPASSDVDDEENR